MREFHAYTLDNWPRRKRGDIIFSSTEEAIYYAHLADDRVSAYHLLEKWRKNTLQDLEAIKIRKPLNYDRMMDLAVRSQLYRESMEEIQRLNESGVI